jgi:hypothetical protein
LLYGVVTGGSACLLGIVLNEYGILPPHIANIASGISALIALIAGSWVVVEKLFPKDMWRRTWKLPVVLLSLVTIVILIIAALFLASLNDPYIHQGKLVLNDPLYNNISGYNWSVLTPSSGGNVCQFEEGHYHDSDSKASKKITPCIARANNFSDFVFEVQMTIIQGDCGGIAFRYNIHTINLYYFAVCQYGGYGLYVYQNTTIKEIIDGNSASFIYTGLKQTNLVAVVARGSTITLYINRNPIASISDSTSMVGQLGVVAASVVSSETEVVYSNAKVWALT